jgi:hypothetical protein
MTTVDERSDRGPVLGVPMTAREYRFLTEFAATRGPLRSLLDSSLIVVELRRDDAIELARAVDGYLPSVRLDVEAALESPQYLSSLTNDELILIRRIRSMGNGRLRVDVQDGVPTVAPEKHWRWHQGGVKGFVDQSLVELIRGELARLSRGRGGTDMDLGAAREGLQSLYEAAAALTQAADGISRVLEEMERGLRQLDEAKEALARLALVKRAVEVPVKEDDESEATEREPEDVDSKGLAQAQAELSSLAESENAIDGKMARRTTHDIVLEAIRAMGTAQFRQSDLRKKLEANGTAIGRSTLAWSLRVLESRGQIVKGSAPGMWRVLAN